MRTMNMGKEQYHEIPIPEERDQVIWDAMRKADRGICLEEYLESS